MSYYTAREVVVLCDITYRQLDYWCRLGYVRPVTEATGSGSRRLFDDDDLRMVRRVKVASTLTSGKLSDVLDRLDDLIAELREPIPA